MRPIKFRGKDRHDRQWVFGNIVKTAYGLYIIPQNIYADRMPQYSVDPETVGQYTGLTDRNGKEIYEGDILHVLEVSNTNDLEYKSPVEFIDSGFLVTQPDECQVPLAVFHNLDTSYPLFEIEAIGNIYEHPYLLAKTR